MDWMPFFLDFDGDLAVVGLSALPLADPLVQFFPLPSYTLFASPPRQVLSAYCFDVCPAMGDFSFFV